MSLVACIRPRSAAAHCSSYSRLSSASLRAFAAAASESAAARDTALSSAAVCAATAAAALTSLTTGPTRCLCTSRERKYSASTTCGKWMANRTHSSYVMWPDLLVSAVVNSSPTVEYVNSMSQRSKAALRSLYSTNPLPADMSWNTDRSFSLSAGGKPESCGTRTRRGE
eukprot:TRINITY_DN2285_c0_g1_i1.p1 TRINITY_DN2285_c0_g1~~TRINITY_DN2285_c0_g1_i1.p1  ORF type:complete len:169 (-),score=28.30 TRINITY_DN2285_c0_g1_i1:408-914(-)